MDRNFAEALKLVLRHEGGFSDHPQDPGGATMRGITLATFRRYVDPKATKDDLRNITQAQLQDVYRRHYWNAVRADDLPDGVDYAVFDLAVNSGPSRAAKFLQAVAGVRQDGKIGPQTIAAVKARMAPTVINDLCDRRMAFLKGLKTWPTFRKGWTARVSDVRAKALGMAAGNTPKVLVAPEPDTVTFVNARPSPPAAQEPAKPDIGNPISPPAPPSPPAATLAKDVPTAHTPSLQKTQTSPGWLSLILSYFKIGA